MKNEIEEYFPMAAAMIKMRETFEIGSLNQICRLVEQDSTLYDSTLQNCFIQFLTTVGDYTRKNNESRGESLALIVIESIIFNLYSKNKPTDKLKLNNSFYRSMSMSMSQMSVELSEASILAPDELKRLTIFIESLSASKKFFKRLKLIGQRHANKARNQRYLQNLLETIEYIMNKEKLKKDNYYDAKKSFLPTVVSKQQIRDNWETVNNIIFSNKLNRVVFMLTDAPDQVHFALNRVYFVGKRNEERRHFRGNKFQAGDMAYNLHKLYISSFSNKLDIFQQGKHPIYRFIASYLQCFFMPEFLKFNQIILKCSKIQYQGGIQQFYRIAQTSIVKDLITFIDQLTPQLVQLMHSLYKIIEGKFGPAQPSMNCTPVKKLLLYSFLVRSDLIQELFQQSADLQKYQEACNNIVSLFFPSSSKKFPEQMTGYMQKLIQKVSDHLDARIINPFIENFYEQYGVSGYFFQQPIINHDYQILATWIKQLEFTPKDLKEFEMKKQNDPEIMLTNRQRTKSSVESPMLKHIKKQLDNPSTPNKFNLEEVSQDPTDFLSFMTVGGVHNWKAQTEENIQKRKKIKNQPSTIVQTKVKKLKFQSFKPEKMKEVSKLYRQFQNIQFNLK